MGYSVLLFSSASFLCFEEFNGVLLKNSKKWCSSEEFKEKLLEKKWYSSFLEEFNGAVQRRPLFVSKKKHKEEDK